MCAYESWRMCSLVRYTGRCACGRVGLWACGRVGMSGSRRLAYTGGCEGAAEGGEWGGLCFAGVRCAPEEGGEWGKSALMAR